jgi:hypothetical protein
MAEKLLASEENFRFFFFFSNLDFDPKVTIVFMICYSCGIIPGYVLFKFCGPTFNPLAH